MATNQNKTKTTKSNHNLHIKQPNQSKNNQKQPKKIDNNYSKFYNFYIKCDSGILKMKTKPAVTYWVKVPSPRPPLQAVVLAHVKDTLIVAIFIAMVYFLVK